MTWIPFSSGASRPSVSAVTARPDGAEIGDIVEASPRKDFHYGLKYYAGMFLIPVVAVLTLADTAVLASGQSHHRVADARSVGSLAIPVSVASTIASAPVKTAEAAGAHRALPASTPPATSAAPPPASPNRNPPAIPPPAPVSVPPAAGSVIASAAANECSVALDYLAVHAKPGYAHYCRPGPLSIGIAHAVSYTCMPGNRIGCPDGGPEIVIADPSCTASYKDEASNSFWDFSAAGVIAPGSVQNGRTWDPYGGCP